MGVLDTPRRHNGLTTYGPACPPQTWPHRHRGHATWNWRRRVGRFVRCGRGRRRQRHVAGGVGRRHPLLRHVSVVRPRSERASLRPRAVSSAARRLRAVHQGRAVVPRVPRRRELRARLLARRAQIPAPLRLQLRWGHAQLRGQPATPRPAPHRSAADPRPGHLPSCHRCEGDGLSDRTAQRRLPRADGTQAGPGSSVASVRASTNLG